MKKFTFILLLLTLSCFGSSAQIDGNQLLQNCKPLFPYLLTGQRSASMTQAETIATGYCMGYVAGVTDTHVAWQLVEGKTNRLTHYCLATDFKNGQVILVFKKYMEAHPEEVHDRADLIIYRALRDAFPM